MASSWNKQFGKGAVIQSTDGATYNQIEEIENPKIAEHHEAVEPNVPSLAEQLAARRAEEEEEYRQSHRNLPPKALDEEEAFFLEAIQREEQIKEDLKRKQQQKDVDSFNVFCPLIHPLIFLVISMCSKCSGNRSTESISSRERTLKIA